MATDIITSIKADPIGSPQNVAAQLEIERNHLLTTFRIATCMGEEAYTVAPLDEHRGNVHMSTNFSGQHFCIREYVAQVRSVDTSKCWPFSASLLEDQNPSLPPLVAPNHRWWASYGNLDTGKELAGQPNGTTRDLELTVSLNPYFSDIEDQRTSQCLVSEVFDEPTDTLDVLSKNPLPMESDKRAGNNDHNTAGQEQMQQKDSDDQIQLEQMVFGTIPKEPILCTDKGILQVQVKITNSLSESAENIEQPEIETNQIYEPFTHVSELFNSEASVPMKMCPVCKTFMSPTVTTVNDHIDNRLAEQTMTEITEVKILKQKAEAHKKRSLADICAALPEPLNASVEVDRNSSESGGPRGLDCFELAFGGTENAIQTQPKKHTTDLNLTTVNGKVKRVASTAHPFMENGKTYEEERHAESLEMKRKRQRLGLMARASDSTEIQESVRMPSAIDISEMHQDTSHHLKNLRKAVLNVDYFKDEQRSSMQVNCEQADDIPMKLVSLMAKNQREPCASLPSHINLKELIATYPNEQPPAANIPENINTLEYILADIQKGGTLGSRSGKEEIGGPTDKSFIPILSDHIGMDVLLSGEEGPSPSGSESSDAALEGSKSFDEAYGHHDKYNLQNSILHTTDSAEIRDVDFQNTELPNEQHYYTLPIAGAATSQEFSSVNEQQKIGPASVTNGIHSLKQDSVGRPNIASQHTELDYSGDNFIAQTEEGRGQRIVSEHSLEKVNNSSPLHSEDLTTMVKTVEQPKPSSETLYIWEKEAIGFDIYVGSKISRPVIVPPRDSRGGSSSTNGQKHTGFSLSRWKQTVSRISKKPMKILTNESADHMSISVSKKINVAPNSAPSRTRAEKSTCTQTNIAGFNDCQGGNNLLSNNKSVDSELLSSVVAEQAAPFPSEVNMFSVCREDIVPKSGLNNAAAYTIQNATNWIRYRSTEKRCSDYGFRVLPLNSQGVLIKVRPNAITGANKLYTDQNPVTVNETLDIKGSEGYPEYMFVESVDTSDHVTVVNETPKRSRDSATCIPKSLHQENYCIQNKQDWKQFSAYRTSQLKIDKAEFSQPPLQNNIPTRKLDGRTSELKFPANVIETPDAGINPPLCMHALFELGSKGVQNQKNSTMEKIISKGQSLEKIPLTSQPVLRLMGQNITVGLGNESGKEMKEFHKEIAKATKSSSEATQGVSLKQKSNMFCTSRCITSTDPENQLYSPECEHNALNPHSRAANKSLPATISEDPHYKFEQACSLETPPSYTSNASKKIRRMNSTIPILVESIFPTNTVFPGLKDQLAFCTDNTPFTPVARFPSNTALDQVDKMMPHKQICKLELTQLSRTGCSPHGACFQNVPANLKRHIRFPQNQIHGQNSCSIHCAYQHGECSQCTHASLGNSETLSPPHCKSILGQQLVNAKGQNETKEPSSYDKGVSESQCHTHLPCKIEMGSVLKQLPCAISDAGPLSVPLPRVKRIFGHPTSNPRASHGHHQTSVLSTPVVNSSTSMVQDKHTFSLLDLTERRKIRLLKDGRCDGNEIKNKKGSVLDKVDNKGNNVQGSEQMPREWFLQKHQRYAQGSLQKSSHFITKTVQHHKRSFFQENTPSSVIVKHHKGREVYQNTLLDAMTAKMCRIIGSPDVFSMNMSRPDCVNSSKKKNTPLQTDLSPKCLKSGVFTKSNNSLLESHVQTFTVGLHFPNAESALKLVEPMILSEGSKQILKPPSTNANATQSFPGHSTLPFVQTATGETENNWQGAHRYSDEHPQAYFTAQNL